MIVQFDSLPAHLLARKKNEYVDFRKVWTKLKYNIIILWGKRNVFESDSCCLPRLVGSISVFYVLGL